jgi:uncharacterized protein YbjQ (UPF0145 family)
MPDKPMFLCPHNMVTTTFELKGYQVATNLGLVRGIVVSPRVLWWERSVLRCKHWLGGDISLFTQLCEDTRRDGIRTNAAARCRIGMRMRFSAFVMTRRKS